MSTTDTKTSTWPPVPPMPSATNANGTTQFSVDGQPVTRAEYEQRHTAARVVKLPIEQIHPSLDNRGPVDIDTLAKSIVEVGLLQPIIVRPRGDVEGGYEIVAGERRYRAACTLGWETVDAIVRDNLSDEAVKVDRLTENIQRVDLTPREEAEQIRDLEQTTGWTQREIASVLGKNQSHVSKRLALLDLPDAIQVRVGRSDAAGITVTEALELHKLKDHPRILTEVVRTEKANGRDGDIAWAVDAALDGIEVEHAKATLRAECQSKGLTILPDDNPKRGHPLAQQIGTWYGHIDVDKRRHTKEPCHAVHITRSYGKQKAEVEAWCTDPRRHTKSGASTLKATSRSQSTMPGKSPAQKRKEAAEREATKARRLFMLDMLTQPAPASFWRLLAERVVEGIYHQEATRLCKLLDIDVPGRAHGRYETALRRYAAKGERQLHQVVYAHLLDEGEQHDYRYGDSHRRLLLDAGYTPHPSEKAAFEKARKAKR